MKRKTIESIIEYIIYFIFGIKLLFLISLVGNIIVKRFKPDLNKKFAYWRDRTEFVFTICVAALMIFIFNPSGNNDIYINSEMKFIFYLFGFVLIFSADWNLFISQAPWYKAIIKIID